MSCVETGCFFQWTIENFQLLPIGTYLESPPFSPNSDPDTRWHLACTTLSNLTEFFLKSLFLPRNDLMYSVTLKYDNVTKCMKHRGGEHSLDPVCETVSLGHFRTEADTKYYGNRNLVFVCHFDGDFFKLEKRTKFHYARTRVKVERYNCDALLDLNNVFVPEGDVYEKLIQHRRLRSSLYISKKNCTLNDLSLQSTVYSYPLTLFTKVYLYTRLGVIVGTGYGFYQFQKKRFTRQVIHFEGEKEKPIGEYVEDSFLKISAQFNVGYDHFTYMERIEDLACIEKLDNQVFELNPYASLRENDLNYKIRVNDQVFYANNYYLRVISPFFKNIVQNENEYETPNIIQIDVVRLKKLFDILYCKDSLSNYKDYSDLLVFYRLCQLYHFVPLIKAISRALVSGFSVTNIGEIFSLSSFYKDQDLRTAAFNYFIVHLKNVLNQQTWRNFAERETKLACEVIIDAVKNSQ